MQGQKIGPYHLHTLVGQGGQSAVWKATDIRSSRVYALKVLRPGLAGPVELARLKREATLLATFSDPGLPRGFELFDDGQGTLALAMEFIDGTSLASAVSQPMQPRQALALVSEVVRIVSVLHGKGVVHRDIKPGNIVVRPGWAEGQQGSVVLVDLGIARGSGQNATSYTATGTAVGTFLFMPPEALLGVVRDDQAMAGDVYAIGVLLWSLLTGRHPTGLPMTATLPQLISVHAQGRSFTPDPSTASALEAAVPGVMTLLAKCLAQDPNVRFSSAAQLRNVLPGPRREATPPPSTSTVQPPNWTGMVSPNQQYTAAPRVQGWTTHEANVGQAQPRTPGGASEFSPTYAVDPSRAAPTQAVKQGSQVSGLRVLALLALLGVPTLLGIVIFARVASRSSTTRESTQPAFQVRQTSAIVVFNAPYPYGLMREGPSSSASVIERLSTGARVTVLSGDNGGWIQVQSASGRVGYMHRDILRLE